MSSLPPTAHLLAFVSAQWPGTNTDPVEVVEGSPELIQLVLADALGISRQDLVLNFIDGAGDGGEKLLPAHADVLQRKERHEGGGSLRKGEEEMDSKRVSEALVLAGL